MNYFNLTQWISNSMLKEFRDLVYGKVKPDNLQVIFDFGNLVDAITLEGKEIEHDVQGRLYIYNEASGEKMYFTMEQYEEAVAMKAAILADADLKMYMEGMKFQHVILRNKFAITFEGTTFYLPIRIKMDGFKKGFMVKDLKTTACETKKACIASITHLDYDQQAALYLDVSGEKRFLFAFVGKKKNKMGQYPVFKVSVTKGDEIYESGKRKYSYWAWKYYWMIHMLNTDSLIINLN